ncbi:ATP-dependent DNA helicase PIF1-like protein [Tanacetum coccineum]
MGKFINKFQLLLDEGACYRIGNFGVSENGGKRFSDTELCDVIGTIVSISDAIPFNTFGVKKIKKIVILEDVEVILAPTHEQVDKVNERMLAKLPGREKVCYSSDYVSDVDIDFKFNESLYTTEFLNTIKMSDIPHQKLVLKIGAPVMCLRNIDQRGGLCNGTMLHVLRMSKNNIEAKIISGGEVGTIVAIPRMNISPSDKKMPFQLNKRQFPVSLCFDIVRN